MAETTVKRLLCCGFRHSGKVMGQAYQYWWRICQEMNVFSGFEYHMFCVLYTFVTYLLTLPHIVQSFDTIQSELLTTLLSKPEIGKQNALFYYKSCCWKEPFMCITIIDNIYYILSTRHCFQQISKVTHFVTFVPSSDPILVTINVSCKFICKPIGSTVLLWAIYTVTLSVAKDEVQIGNWIC
jgi:hypothetical protein